MSIHGRGAGLIIDSGSPTIVNCKFTRNYALTWGAGIANTNSSSAILRCEFTNNVAEAGAAINNDDGRDP